MEGDHPTRWLGSVKAGDIFHYKWDETGWHERPVSQAEIDRGYMGEMKNNQVQENGKIGVFGIGSNGDSYVAEAYFSDAAGNIGKKGQDEIVFDFTGVPRTKLDASAIYGNGDETFLFLDHGRKSDKDITEAANGKTVEIDVKTFTHGSEVKLDNGDDIVTVNNKHGWGWINEDSKLDLGRGNNTLNVSTNIDKSTVIAGNGDDVVTVGKWQHAGDSYITNHSNINLGDGNNKLTVGTNIDSSKVATGSGDDVVEVGGYILNASGKIAGTNEEYGVNLGNGDNKLTVENYIKGSIVTTGDGDDIVNVGNYVTNSTINLGDGDNALTVESWINGDTKIISGKGADTINIDDDFDKSTLLTGAGSDKVTIGGDVKNKSSLIDLGAGDDTIAVGNIENGKIDGGDGYDKLAITNPGRSINLDSIADHAHNFEELNISNKSQNTTLSVKLSDVISLTDGDNTLKITADAGDKVEFKDTGWQKGASTDGYTAYTNDTSGTTVTVEIKDEVTQPM
ncbi:hypothetical protein [Campylobacter concisus]|uniref:hypothetical protein n=1 Tax=Campylobacter concisus TaxID=199 RepID=UPI00112F7E3F|nr:hypothetical protein [Campylobacter concisus]